MLDTYGLRGVALVYAKSNTDSDNITRNNIVILINTRYVMNNCEILNASLLFM